MCLTGPYRELHHLPVGPRRVVLQRGARQAGAVGVLPRLPLHRGRDEPLGVRARRRGVRIREGAAGVGGAVRLDEQGVLPVGGAEGLRVWEPGR